MFLWSSEISNHGPVNVSNLYTPIKGETGVLRIVDDEATGSSATEMIFLGPESEEIARKWVEFVQPYVQKEEDLDVNMNTQQLIKRFIEQLN